MCCDCLFFADTFINHCVRLISRQLEIPNGLVIACIVPAAMAVFAFPDVTLTERLIGFFSVSLPLFAITLAVPGAFGGGDIKLMAVIGFFLGWKMSLTAFMLAVFSGGIYGIGLLLSKKKGCKRAFCIWPVFVRRDSADFICGRMAAFLVSIHNFLKGGTYAKVSIYGEGCRRKEEKRAAYGS